MLGLNDEYVAYCLDEAVVHFGETVEGLLQRIQHKNPKHLERMRLNKLRVILGQETKKTFRTPTLTK